jgi:general secretion pathway protein M
MSALPLSSPRQDRDRRLALAVLVAAIVAVIAIVAVPTWLVHRHYDTALSEATTRLERFGRISSTRPVVAKQLEAMRAKDTRRYFLRSGGAALSAAEAQETVRSLIESSGGRLITMQAPVAKEEGHYRLITANVQMQANIFALRKILGAIDTNVPVLFVDNLTIRSQVPSNFRPQPGAEPEMFVQFDISGYALTGTP